MDDSFYDYSICSEALLLFAMGRSHRTPHVTSHKLLHYSVFGLELDFGYPQTFWIPVSHKLLRCQRLFAVTIVLCSGFG